MKNKIKGSADFFSAVRLFIIFAVGSVVCVSLRFYQVFRLIDGQTGFYLKKSPLSTVFWVFLVLFCIIIAVGSYLSGNEVSVDDSFYRKNYPAGIAGIFVGLSFLLDSMLSLTLDLSHSSMIKQSTLLTGKFMPLKLQALFAFLSFLYFIVFSVRSLKDKPAKNKLMALFPVFWGVVKMITLFVNQISYMRISDLVLEIAATALLTVFFLSLAQNVNGIYSETSLWRILGVGLPASVLCLCANIPKLAAMLSGNGDKISPDFPICYVEIFVAIFIIITAVCIIKDSAGSEEITELSEKDAVTEYAEESTVHDTADMPEAFEAATENTEDVSDSEQG